MGSSLVTRSEAAPSCTIAFGGEAATVSRADRSSTLLADCLEEASSGRVAFGAGGASGNGFSRLAGAAEFAGGRAWGSGKEGLPPFSKSSEATGNCTAVFAAGSGLGGGASNPVAELFG